MSKQPDASNLDSVFNLSESSRLGTVLRSQEFWIFIAILIIGAVVGAIAPRFLTMTNMANILQNFCFIALMAIGMTPVIMTGGIDISVGSTLGLTGVVLGLLCASGYSFPVVVVLVIAVGAFVGLINGSIISYLKLPPFIVTLGMMSLVRSQTLVVTNNQVVYDFGQAQDALLALGSGSSLGVPNVLWAVIVAAAIVQLMLSMTR